GLVVASASPVTAGVSGADPATTTGSDADGAGVRARGRGGRVRSTTGSGVGSGVGSAVGSAAVDAGDVAGVAGTTVTRAAAVRSAAGPCNHDAHMVVPAMTTTATTPNTAHGASVVSQRGLLGRNP